MRTPADDLSDDTLNDHQRAAEHAGATFGMATTTQAALDHGCVRLWNRDGGKAILTQSLILTLASAIRDLPDDEPPVRVPGPWDDQR